MCQRCQLCHALTTNRIPLRFAGSPILKVNGLLGVNGVIEFIQLDPLTPLTLQNMNCVAPTFANRGALLGENIL